MKIKMEIVPNSYQEEDGFEFCMANIFIGNDFWETNMMALNHWSVEDYQRQWKEGLKRIKTYATSCLVSSVQNPETTPPLINWWILYKIGNSVMIQNKLLVDEVYDEVVGNKVFSPDSCYTFIPTRKTTTMSGFPISEWEVQL